MFKAPNNGGAPITSYTVTCFVNIFKQWIVTGPPVPFKGRLRDLRQRFAVGQVLPMSREGDEQPGDWSDLDEESETAVS